ncbi:hypothetical protein [Bacillus subtilis]|uniref:hypothetical protein n=1 Tax=Bacillus subtilis TaxID=1423 RepID=UPI0007EC2386|nr:hypothetical protein [Bacillus subtilis]MCM3386098.1 hypothetical protein [Bacillus subtilis]MDM5455648.1 hypothetical protein [Bacillus subtilis]MDW4547527.1 hypothetical protein [Bacillus subtilis subsp. subtilis]OAZ70493.1 hypothetical protein SRCM101280_01131 [Bacillus subtilis]CAF1785767.1 hypothetical protein NRS6108_04195 [Bacillus subtilis]
MSLSVKTVYDLLMNDQEIGNLMNKDMIFSINVPEDFQKVENAPIICITQISDFQSRFVSNKAFSSEISVQITVWASDLAKIDQFKTRLDTLMGENNWSQYTGMLDRDPTIDLFMLARRYRTTEILNDLSLLKHE